MQWSVARLDSDNLRPAARVATIAFCAEAAHTLLFIPLLQAYLPGHFHWTPAFPGYALTAFATAKLIAQAPSGRLVDRIGTRLSTIGGLSLLLICGLLFAVLRLPLLFLAVACLYGVAASLLWPALFAFVAGRFREALRGRLAAVIQLAEASGVGVGVGAGALLVDHAGYGAGFALYFALLSLALLAILSTHRRGSERPVAIPSERAPALRGAFHTPLTLNLALLLGTGALLTLAPNLLMPILRIYAVQNLHVQLDELIVPLLPVAAVGALALLASGAASDRVGRLPLTLGGLCLGVAGLWLLGGAHSLTFAISAATLGTAGYLTTQPAWSAAVFDASQAQHRGAQFGLIMVVQGLAEALAPALGGKVAEMHGPGAVFRLAAVALAAATLITLVLLMRTRKHHQQPGPLPAVPPR